MTNDAQLQRNVLDELNWDPSIKPGHIGVIVEDGIVTLTGHLPVYSEKHSAEVIVKRIHGVKGVANEIEVRPSDTHVCDDTELASAAVHALEWDAQVPHRGIQVTVEDGHLVLDGTVAHGYQRAAAESAVRHLNGIRGITNEITVDPDGISNDTKSEIESALRRSALLNPRQISVEMDDGTVVLTGDVATLAEIDEAVRTAHSARGVNRVVNCMTLTPWGTGPSEEWGY